MSSSSADDAAGEGAGCSRCGRGAEGVEEIEMGGSRGSLRGWATRWLGGGDVGKKGKRVVLVFLDSVAGDACCAVLCCAVLLG